jgi:hypothetical protein
VPAGRASISAFADPSSAGERSARRSSPRSICRQDPHGCQAGCSCWRSRGSMATHIHHRAGRWKIFGDESACAGLYVDSCCVVAIRALQCVDAGYIDGQTFELAKSGSIGARLVEEIRRTRHRPGRCLHCANDRAGERLPGRDDRSCGFRRLSVQRARLHPDHRATCEARKRSSVVNGS